MTDQERVLVTGATGFIATHVIRTLLKEGYLVRGTVRPQTAQARIEELRNISTKAPTQLEIVEGDLLDEDCWKSNVKDC